MVESTLFANRGTPVSAAAIAEDRVDDMSLGELLYAQAFFAQQAATRLAQPDSIQEVATFIRGSGADWSGFHTDHTPTASEHAAAVADADQNTAGQEPLAPDNYVDTMPAMLDLLDRSARVTDAAFAHLFGLLETAHRNQEEYLGVPADSQGFKNPVEVLRQQLRMSRHQAKKHETRAKYIAHASDTDRTTAGAAPRLPQLAAAYTAGTVPTEQLEKLIAFDSAATKHAAKTGHSPDYKNAVLEVFEPTLVEAAQTDTPEQLNQAKQGWLELLAYHIDPDGPPPSLTTKKQPDNALHVRNHADGSATASMHMDPMWAAFMKEFLNTNLNYRGNMPLLPDNIQNLYEAMADAKATQQDQDGQTATTNSSNDGGTAGDNAADEVPTDQETTHTADKQHASKERQGPVDAFSAAVGSPPDGGARPANQIEQELPHPTGLDEVVAEDEHGQPFTRRQVEWIDTLTRAERAGIIILGALYRMMSLPPDEAVKQAHGSPAKLVVVQDIQTAYHTLGLPPVPEAVRRPTGPAGMLPAIVKPPDSNDPDDPEEGFTGHANPVAWTPYHSGIVNVGPVHPGSIQPGLCDVDLVGQIWNGQDVVLNEYRTKRLFTAAQRRAIFARDKGCQAPGCTVQATYCQCHHCKEWSNNGLTNENNAITLCARHHADIHDGKWTIRKLDGRTYFQPAKWLDPAQPLLRNTYWKF